MPIKFALVGPTGIGKSKLSLDLARYYSAEIIGVDSRQIYKGFSIGTAQPDRESLAMVKHHLVDFLDPRETYSSGDFCRDVKNLMAANPDQNYILVGGTGFYLQSLMLGLPQMPEIDPEIRTRLTQELEKDGYEAVLKKAMVVDPELVEKIPDNNVQRLLRVLEVWEGTGKKLSEWQQNRVGGIGEIPIFLLDRPREELYQRINARVDAMMKDGWLKEVDSLSKMVDVDAPAWQSLGYRELLDCIRHGSLVDVVLDDVKKKTRNFAKRQLTWFRWQVKSTTVPMGAANPMEKIVSALESHS